ncbi:MAG: hypothetical protein WBC37_15125 [Burkholderiaceae bacterium]
MPSLSMPLSRRAPRIWRVLGALALLLLLQACATRAPRPAAVVAEPAFGEARARQIVAVWRQQLADYLEDAGGGDPAALAQLPTLRATGTLRPARIVVGALDVEASVAERDGFDVQGLLLAPRADAGSEPYVFVVGIVQRAGYRPVALVDIRLVAMTARGGRLEWTVGDGDPQALMRYRALLDPTAPLRFPADKDRFELVPCAPRLCVGEQLSSARWNVDLPATAGAAKSQ